RPGLHPAPRPPGPGPGPAPTPRRAGRPAAPGGAGGLTHTILVYTGLVEATLKNITLSADERVIEAARERARRERTTLNEQFRRWLEEYAAPDRSVEDAMELLDEIRSYVRTGGRKFTREEMNER